MAGLGLLPVRTTFGSDKRTTRSSGAFCEVQGALAALAGVRVEGYEIHMGTTERVGGKPLVRLGGGDDAGTLEGCQAGNVYGCYLHGLFDLPGANQALVSALAVRKGIDVGGVAAVDLAAYRERQFDVLAEGLRASMDLDLVRHIIEEGL